EVEQRGYTATAGSNPADATGHRAAIRLLDLPRRLHGDRRVGRGVRCARGRGGDRSQGGDPGTRRRLLTTGPARAGDRVHRVSRGEHGREGDAGAGGTWGALVRGLGYSVGRPSVRHDVLGFAVLKG